MDTRRQWTENKLGQFIVNQVTHTAITAIILLSVFFGATRVGALKGVLAPNTQTADASLTTINYQGRLANSDGTPVSDKMTFTFSLYDADVGGNLLWGEEIHANVPVSDGLFSVRLGQDEALPPNLFDSGDVWLEIEVKGETLSPREKLTAVPYAMVAGEALTVPDGSVTGAKIRDGSISADDLSSSLIFSLPSVHESVRDEATTIPIDGVTVGDAQITLQQPGKVFATCDVSLQPDPTPKPWIGMSISAQNGTSKVSLGHAVYQGTSSTIYTTHSTSGILSLPAGTWTIQCDFHRTGSGDDPIIHTYRISAVQVE